jgi:hypothetical protein
MDPIIRTVELLNINHKEARKLLRTVQEIYSGGGNLPTHVEIVNAIELLWNGHKPLRPIFIAEKISQRRKIKDYEPGQFPPPVPKSFLEALPPDAPAKDISPMPGLQKNSILDKTRVNRGYMRQCSHGIPYAMCRKCRSGNYYKRKRSK